MIGHIDLCAAQGMIYVFFFVVTIKIISPTMVGQHRNLWKSGPLDLHIRAFLNHKMNTKINNK